MKNWNEESSRRYEGAEVTQAQYKEVLDNVYKRNGEVLERFSVLTGTLFLVMFVVALICNYERRNLLLYGIMAVVEASFFAVYHFNHEGGKRLITTINYSFFVVAFLYATIVSFSDPSTPAVAFFVFLILMPEMLIDKPSRIIGFMSVATLMFCVVTWVTKDGLVAWTDMCNALWVLVLSVALTTQHVKLRITGLVVRQQIESERDLDSLTGFFTKQASKREVQKMMDTHRVGAFVFLDIDNFKQINDNFGHDFGDEVLRKLADYIASYNHTTEVCGRFGGDEFLVYISDFDNKEAVFQRVHFLLSNLKNNLDYPELDVHPKLSAGIAFYPEDGREYDELLRHADSAMYYSKHHGKARVTAYSEASTKMKYDVNAASKDTKKSQ